MDNYAEEFKILHPKKWNHQISKSAVILLPDFKHLDDLHDRVELVGKSYRPLKFIVYCKDLVYENLQRLSIALRLTRSKGHISMYEHLLIETPSSYNLFHIEWFNSHVCNEPKFVYINKFLRKTLDWSKKLVNPVKYKNFYGCKLILGIRKVKIDEFCDNYSKINSRPDVELFMAMSKKANFIFDTVELNFFNGQIITLDKNISFSNVNAFFPLLTSTVEYTSFHLTTQFLEEKIGFLLTPSAPYTSYEKLLMPFDEATWIYLTAVFLCAFLFIFVINHLPKKYQDFFYGTNVKTAAFNVVGTFFGIGQTQLPDANFTRIILMTFILFCLLIRTAYQSILFEYEASDMRKPSPKTIEDLWTENYVIYLINESLPMLKMMPSDKMPAVKVFYNCLHLQNVKSTEINNMDARIAFFGELYQHQMEKNFYENQPVLLEQQLYSHVAGYALATYNFLYDLTNDVLNSLITGGIIQHDFEMVVFNRTVEYNLFRRFEDGDDDEKNPMTLEELYYGFNLWIVASLICVIVFLAELNLFYVNFNSIVKKLGQLKH